MKTNKPLISHEKYAFIDEQKIDGKKKISLSRDHDDHRIKYDGLDDTNHHR